MMIEVLENGYLKELILLEVGRKRAANGIRS
jgi:hypothetical protein